MDSLIDKGGKEDHKLLEPVKESTVSMVKHYRQETHVHKSAYHSDSYSDVDNLLLFDCSQHISGKLKAGSVK